MKQGYQFEQSEQEYIEQQKAGVQIAVTFLNNVKDVLMKVMDVALEERKAVRAEIGLDRVASKLDDIIFRMDLKKNNCEPKNYK